MTTTEHTDLISVTVDGIQVEVPKDTLIIRAAEQAGIEIPRFCDHPLLKPAGACRQCLVEVATPDREGNVRKMPKPQASCAMTVSPGMEVYTQVSSTVAKEAQEGIMEFLLINHPLDCPVCDKGGECPLQNQALSHGRAHSRFTDVKRTFPKPIKISTQVLLDRDRCILCQRCTRFSSQISGDAFIALQGRGGGSPGYELHALHGSQVGRFDEDVLSFSDTGESEPAVFSSALTGPGGEPGIMGAYNVGPIGSAELDESGRPFASYFSGNTIQICPVGALTSASYRFRARPFDLVSVDSVAEHDASGAAVRIDTRRGVVLRRLSGNDPEVNEEWLTDKDRFAFPWQTSPDRLEMPLVRDEVTGELVPTSWSDALDVAARGLAAAGDDGGVAALPGGRLTVEDAYAWSAFARRVLGTNDIDARARVSSAEEDRFLASRVAGTGLGVTFADLEAAPQVLLVAFEPEDEAGNVFLRLRKGVLATKVAVTTLAPFATRGSLKLRANVILTSPGREASVLRELDSELVEALKAAGSVILVGERAAASPGALTAVAELADATGARLAWIPRRAGERGAVDAGALPHLLPGGRPVTDAAARIDASAVWANAEIPAEPGRDLPAILEALASGELGGVMVGGVDVRDLPEPDLAREALQSARFVVQLEVRRSELTEYADVVLPVAPPMEKAGTFINWEGRLRPFGQVMVSRSVPDRKVLHQLAEEMGFDLGLERLADAVVQISEFDAWTGERPAAEPVAASTSVTLGEGEAVLATFKLMLDDGRLQDGEPHLAGTAHRPVARISPARAESLGVGAGDEVTIAGPGGEITLPLMVTPMNDDVVWVPQNSPGSHVYEQLGAGSGAVVRVKEVAK